MTKALALTKAAKPAAKPRAKSKGPKPGAPIRLQFPFAVNCGDKARFDWDLTKEKVEGVEVTDELVTVRHRRHSSKPLQSLEIPRGMVVVTRHLG